MSTRDVLEAGSRGFGCGSRFVSIVEEAPRSGIPIDPADHINVHMNVRPGQSKDDRPHDWSPARHSLLCIIPINIIIKTL